MDAQFQHPMSLGSTVYVFIVRLADSDRHVYQTLELRMARHSSETPEYLVTRLLAYCLEYQEGIAFSKGLSDPDEPAIAVRDLTGQLHTWIDIGAPEAPRLHKASKAARRVVVYAHKDTEAWLTRLAGERIHRSEMLELYSIDRDFIAALAALLARRMELDLSVSERHLYVTIGEVTLSGVVVQSRLVE